MTLKSLVANNPPPHSNDPSKGSRLAEEYKADDKVRTWENGLTEQIWFKVKGSGLRVDIIHKKPFNVEAERLSIILSIIFYPNV